MLVYSDAKNITLISLCGEHFSNFKKKTCKIVTNVEEFHEMRILLSLASFRKNMHEKTQEKTYFMRIKMHFFMQKKTCCCAKISNLAIIFLHHVLNKFWVKPGNLKQNCLEFPLGGKVE